MCVKTEFTGAENDGLKIFNNWKIQDTENDGLNRRAGKYTTWKMCFGFWSIIFKVLHFRALRFGPSFSAQSRTEQITEQFFFYSRL